jgi:recombination protein RecT
MTASAVEQAPQPRPLSSFEKFRNYVQTTQFVHEVAALVGGEAQARTFVRVVLTAVQQTPDLLSADRRSLLLACMKAARDKLMPDGKEAVFNIYTTKQKVDGRDQWVPTVQYLPMVAGLIKKLYASGVVSFVDACCVYERDEFAYERGDAPRLVHRPFLGGEPGEIVAAYVVVKLTSGEVKREVMPRRDIEKVRAASKAPDGPGWKNWYDQFAIKAVIKRAYKQLPSSVELEQVIAADNDAIGFADFANATDESLTAPSAVDSINARVRPQQAAAPALEHAPAQGIPTTIEGKAERVTVDRDAARMDVDARVADSAAGDPPPKSGPTFAQVAEQINAAKDADALAIARDLIRGVGDDAQRADLETLARFRADEFAKAAK